MFSQPFPHFHRCRDDGGDDASCDDGDDDADDGAKEARSAEPWPSKMTTKFPAPEYHCHGMMQPPPRPHYPGPEK